MALTLGRQTLGGINRYSFELALALDRRDDVEVVPVGPLGSLQRLTDDLGFCGAGAIETPNGSAVNEALYLLARADARVRDAGVDVLHCTKHLVPVRRSLPTVLTLYDLTLFERPHDYALLKQLALPPLHRRAIASVDAAVAVSEPIRQAMIPRFPAMKSLVAIGLAPPTALLAARPAPIDGLKPGGFAVFVGDLIPRKNPGLLVAVWDEVHRRTGLKLAFVGGAGIDRARMGSLIDDLVSRGVAVRVGRVSEGRLRWAYENCAVVCVPSLDEGFGFPLNEAIAFGAPAVATDLAVFRGAASGVGNVRLLPPDPNLWTEYVANEVFDHTAPSVLRTWDEVAEDHMAVYRRVAGRP